VKSKAKATDKQNVVLLANAHIKVSLGPQRCRSCARNLAPTGCKQTGNFIVAFPCCKLG